MVGVVHRDPAGDPVSAQLRVYGASDDCIEFEGAIDDEFDIGPGNVWAGEIFAPNGDCLVIVLSFGGTWSVGVAPREEGAFLPTWPLTIGNATANDYSAMLTIEVPDGIKFRAVTL